MPRLLHKIGKPDEQVRKLNDNFSYITQDLVDRSGVISTKASVGPITIANGDASKGQISILNTLIDAVDRFRNNEVPVILRFDMFINNDDDFTYVWPLGANLTDAQLEGIRFEHGQYITRLDVIDNEVATAYFLIKNDSGASVDFYVDVDVYFTPSPDQAIYARGS